MQAVRIRQLLESDTLHLPQIRPLLGREVEIIVLVDDLEDNRNHSQNDGERYPLRGSVLRYDEPFDSAAADEWEADR